MSSAKHTYRRWSIGTNFINEWEATHPDYDASYEGPEDGWVANPNMRATARTLPELYEGIDECERALAEQAA
jgi:hypothetical protein